MKKVLSIHNIFQFDSFMVIFRVNLEKSIISVQKRYYKMFKCLQVTVCHLMSYFLTQFQNTFCRTYSVTISFARVTRMLVAFPPSFYNLKTHFLPSCAYLLSALLYNWYYWQRNAYYFYNMPEMRITFVLLSLMSDKHVST